MTNEQKQQIKNALVRFALTFPTQADAAARLTGVSSAVISHIRNNNWDKVSEQLWLQVARQVGYYCFDWKAADTGAYLLISALCRDAQNYSLNYGVSFGKGLGKTFTALKFMREQDNVLYLACCKEFSGRSLIAALLHLNGLDDRGTLPELIKRLVNHIEDKDLPLIILDDAEKMNENVIPVLADLFKKLKDKCGLVVLGNIDFSIQITDGVRLAKKGYADFYKIIGRKFVTLKNPAPQDIPLICRANGVHDTDLIQYIVEQSRGNLKETARLIHQTYSEKAA